MAPIPVGLPPKQVAARQLDAWRMRRDHPRLISERLRRFPKPVATPTAALPRPRTVDVGLWPRIVCPPQPDCDGSAAERSQINRSPDAVAASAESVRAVRPSAR